MEPGILDPKATRRVDGAYITNFLTGAECSEVSVAKTIVDGTHGPTLNVRSTRLYHVIAGQCVCTIEGETLSAKQGDTILIPSGHTHSVTGSVELLVINAPAFRPEDERVA
jgi:mannose-6-phosphate isomerase-like protein (cupin superfamily)